jgi:APA family basic amino acid/polyamine antiporter
MGAQAPKTVPPPKDGLRRDIGFWGAISLVIGAVLGSGIFLKHGRVAADAGDVGLILTSWVLGGVVCLLGALSVAELAAMMPRAGGLYVYLREAYGAPVAFLAGWNDFLFTKPGTMSALAWAVVGLVIPTEAPTMLGLRVLAALGLLAAVALLNYRGVAWARRLLVTTTTATMLGLGAIVLLPFFVRVCVAPGAVAVHLSSTPGQEPTYASFGGRLALVLLAVMWAYSGWHNATPAAEEIHDPQKTLPRAMLWGITALVLLYTTVSVAVHGTMPLDEVAQAGEYAVLAVAGRLLGAAGTALLGAVLLFSMLGKLNGDTIAGSRVLLAMGRDYPALLRVSQVHPRYGTPGAAILVQAAVAAALVCLAAALKYWLTFMDPADAPFGVLRRMLATVQRTSLFTLLSNLVVFGVSLFHTLAVLAVLVLRVRRPDWPRPYRTFAYPMPPLLYAAFYGWLIVRIYNERPLEANTGLLLIGTGLAAYLLLRPRGCPGTSIPPVSSPSQ